MNKDFYSTHALTIEPINKELTNREKLIRNLTDFAAALRLFDLRVGNERAYNACAKCRGYSECTGRGPGCYFGNTPDHEQHGHIDTATGRSWVRLQSTEGNGQPNEEEQ